MVANSFNLTEHSYIMTAKNISETIENCLDCPASFWEEDDNPMGGNGWLRCKKLGRRIVHECWYEGIDPECPLENTQDTSQEVVV